jgi:glycosyltransferase involved in cell wall biosynthesis
MAPWYDAPFEEHLLRTADIVTAVSRTLVKKVASVAHREAALVPNGWRAGTEVVAKPVSLPRGDCTVGYFGHLTPAWFDWGLLTQVAKRRPKWLFHLIGYGADGRRRSLPANVILHGKVPQTRLAAYAANWDVAVVPFKAGPVAEAADVIKAYEYLAMGLPVVETGVYPPAGAEDLVFRAASPEQFTELVGLAARSGPELRPRRQAFAASSTWDTRASAIVSLLDEGAQRTKEQRALVGERA